MNCGKIQNDENPIENVYLDVIKLGTYKYWVEFFEQHEPL